MLPSTVTPPPTPSPSQSPLLGFKVVGLVLCWYIVSSISNNLSKEILSTIASPFTLTYVQFWFKAGFSAVSLMRLGTFPRLPWSDLLLLIAPLSAGTIFSHMLSHFSLGVLAVSFTQTIKATSPIFAVLLSRVFLGERFSVSILISLIPIVGGVTLCTLTEINFDALGFTSAVIATLAFVGQSIYSKHLFRTHKFDHIVLVMYVAIVALVILTPAWLIRNGIPLASQEITLQQARRALGMFLFNGVSHWLQTVLAFKALQMVSPVTYSIANSLKRVFVIVSSVLWFNNWVSFTNGLGIVIAIIGMFMYNRAKLEQRLLAAESPANDHSK